MKMTGNRQINFIQQVSHHRKMIYVHMNLELSERLKYKIKKYNKNLRKIKKFKGDNK